MSYMPSDIKFLRWLQAVDATSETNHLDELHWDLHKAGSFFKLNDKARDLVCPVCCGLPPWEWDGMWEAHTVIVPTRQAKRPHPRLANSAPRGKHYRVEYWAFGWRVPRLWGYTKMPFGACSKCNEWGEVARHYPGEEHSLYGHIWPRMTKWESLHVCLKCIKKENQDAKRLDQAKEVKRLIEALNPKKKRGPKNAKCA